MDGVDLLVPTDRRAIEEQIERDDPFCVVMPFPCGPWNSLTYWNASRHPEFKVRNEALQKKHVPMLKWLCSIAKKRIARGRLVLMENGQTSRAWNLKCFEELEGLLDGLQPEASFEYGIGDQCLLGQHDRESGEPMRGRTKWGTNGEILRSRISIRCGSNEHQQIMGSNQFGLRSIQKATWPEEMCAVILEAIVEELDHRTCCIAFPAEIAQEEAEELGTLDSVTNAEPQQVIGTELGENAEQEQELLDSLTLDGFPAKEDERRKAWMSLPRATRAAIRRLHIMIGHKPKAVLVQIMKGARVSREIIDAVKFFKCDHCAEVSNASSVARVKAPSLYSFNHELIIDIFYNHDMEGTLYGWLSIVCNGTTFHIVTLVQIGKGQPTSIKCSEKFQSCWTHWAGFPKYLVADRGLHKRCLPIDSTQTEL